MWYMYYASHPQNESFIKSVKNMVQDSQNRIENKCVNGYHYSGVLM